MPGGTVVLSYNYWTQRLASDPNVLGKSITLSGSPYTIVGVVGREFDVRDLGGEPAEVWVPFQLDPNTTDQGHYFTNVARLKPGVSLEQAQAALMASATAYRDRYTVAAMSQTAGFSTITLTRGARAPGAADAARRARRRRLRAADRVRERREPAADPRDGSAPRARVARRARRRALARHAPAVDREPDAVAGGRRTRSRCRLRSACAC